MEFKDGSKYCITGYGKEYIATVLLCYGYSEIDTIVVNFTDGDGNELLHFEYYKGAMSDRLIYEHIQSTLFKLMWPTYTANHKGN